MLLYWRVLFKSNLESIIQCKTFKIQRKVWNIHKSLTLTIFSRTPPGLELGGWIILKLSPADSSCSFSDFLVHWWSLSRVTSLSNRVETLAFTARHRWREGFKKKIILEFSFRVKRTCWCQNAIRGLEQKKVNRIFPISQPPPP